MSASDIDLRCDLSQDLFEACLQQTLTSTYGGSLGLRRTPVEGQLQGGPLNGLLANIPEQRLCVIVQFEAL